MKTEDYKTKKNKQEKLIKSKKGMYILYNMFLRNCASQSTSTKRQSDKDKE